MRNLTRRERVALEARARAEEGHEPIAAIALDYSREQIALRRASVSHLTTTALSGKLDDTGFSDGVI